LARSIIYLQEHVSAFRAATVLLTGSSSIDLTASADLLHGQRDRWPRPLDRLRLPMNFRDYAAARNPDAVPAERVALDDLLKSVGRDAVRTTALRTGLLDQYLGEYLRSGGLPVPVGDVLTGGQLAPDTAVELWRGLSADVRPLGRNDLAFRKLVSRTVAALSGWPAGRRWRTSWM
jgi:hypothetical protein